MSLFPKFAFRTGNLLLTGALAATLSGCSHGPYLSSHTGLTVNPDNTLPMPGRLDLAGNDRAYFVGPRDRLNIEVLGVPEFTQKLVEVDSGGNISFPLAGSVNANGLTIQQLASAIEARLRASYMRNPKVTVNLAESRSRVVTVEGEVKEPGIYPVIGRMTLLGALASAKGTTELTSFDDIVVFRTVGERKYAALYSLKAIRRGAYEDPQIFPNDIVAVGDSRGRKLFRDILQTVPLLTTPLVVWLQN